MSFFNRIRVGFRWLFYLPGTLMHELFHFIPLLPLGFRRMRISLTPKMAMEGHEIVMGQVSASLGKDMSRLRWLIPAIAPKLWWVLLYFALEALQIVTLETASDGVVIGLSYASIDWSEPASYLYLYALMQMLWAGTLSFQDYKVAFGALLSFWGLFLLISGVLLYATFSHSITDGITYALERTPVLTSNFERINLMGSSNGEN